MFEKKCTKKVYYERPNFRKSEIVRRFWEDCNRQVSCYRATQIRLTATTLDLRPFASLRDSMSNARLAILLGCATRTA